MLLNRIFTILFLFFITVGFSQSQKPMLANQVTTAYYMKEIKPLTGRKLIPAKPRKGKINPKQKDANKIVPGKGYPKGKDPLVDKQKKALNRSVSRPPLLTFEVNSSTATPTDPTGAIGPNHYVSAKNFAFAIHDRSGNVLVPSTSLENLFPSENKGDPIVFYDGFANRFVITQFSDTPNGFLVAICKGADPVNDGWYTYRFNTGSFPDYTKFSIWSDGYYVTANKDQNAIEANDVVFVIEREKMIKGDASAKMVSFPLPGAKVGGFYSPASFNAIGGVLPPKGDARIIYFQDDEWEGVSKDILKLWEINVNWVSPSQSTIKEAEEIEVTPFDSTFDGGSTANIPQPGINTQKIDVLQGAIMYATNYRRFCDYNAVVLNFPIDIDVNADSVSGIRWYELRQNEDGQPWEVFQEGTYVSPNGKSAWCGSMGMDVFGNIGMGYTTMGTISTGAIEDSFVSIRYTGRLASDPLGVMTVPEETILEGTAPSQNGGNRYGDYAHLTVDPIDDQTFWHIAEHFSNTTNNARNTVGVFKIANNTTSDVGVVSIDAPFDDNFTANETITVTLKNYGSSAQSNIPVSYSVNGGVVVNELYAGSIPPLGTVSFSFTNQADLSAEGMYSIDVETSLVGDANIENNCASLIVNNLFADDVGVGELISPELQSGISNTLESVVVTLYNYGTTSQTEIPVFYRLNDGNTVNEVFEGTLLPQEEVTYTFATMVDAKGIGDFKFTLGTALNLDENSENDTIERIVKRIFCKPTSNCKQSGDGITSFKLSNVYNPNIPCTNGYEDFTDNFKINLSRSIGTYVLRVRSGFADNEGSERISLWIDFNDDRVFENSELLIDNQIIEKRNADQDFSFSIPKDAPLQKHLLRIRGGDVSGNNKGALLNEPCGSMSFGTTHDYTVEIGENADLETGLIVISEPDNMFVISKTDFGIESQKRLYIFNVLGQVIVSNNVEKDANGRFVYALNMSFAQSGIYFARLGNDKKDEATRFVVK